MSPVEGRADPAAVQHGVEEPAVGAEAAEVSGAGGTTNVATLRLYNSADRRVPALRDVVAGLRAVADGIEKGVHGDVVRAALVLRSANLEPLIFGHGDTTMPQTYMDFHAGAQQLMSMRHPERS